MMAGREYWSKSAPTGRSPSSAKWLCCAIEGLLCCGAPGSGCAFVPANVRRNAGARAEEGGVFCTVLALCDESAQWAEKTWEFSTENGLLLCETRGLSSEKSPLFLRPSHWLTLRCPRAAASLGSGGGNVGMIRQAKAKKSPSSPRRGRGVRPQNDRERDDQRAL